jgi:photosystem II stability/assembly factor-like uncharacterized protein
MSILLITTTAVPAQADDSSRVNQGIYGANVYDMAYDAKYDIVWAAVEGALSLFWSADSGKTWEAAYPGDSLEFQRDGHSVGWGGGGRMISTDNGIGVAMNAEEGGSLVSAVITPDGGQTGWTLYDASLKNDIKAQLDGIIHPDRELGLTMVKSVNGLVFLGMGNIVLASSDTGNTWEVAGIPDTSIIDSNIAPGDMPNINDIIACGESTDSMFILVDGGVGSNSRNVMVTVDGAATFHPLPVCDTSGMSDQLPIIDTIMVDSTQFDPMKGTALDTIDDSITVQIVDSSGRRCEYIEDFFAVGAHGDTLIAREKSVSNNTTVSGLNALHVSVDGGAHWTRVFKEEPGMNLGHVSVFEDPSFAHGLRIVAGAKYSDDLGATWNDMQAVDPAQIGEVPSKIVCHIPGSDIYLGTSNAGIWRADAGINDSFDLSVEGLASVTIYDIAQCTSNLDKVVLATKSGIAITNAYTDETVAYADKWHGSYGAFPMLNNRYAVVGINPYDTAEVWACNFNGVRHAETNAVDESNWSPADQGKFGMAMGGSFESYVTDLDYEALSNGGGEPSSIAFFAEDTIYISLRCARSSYGGVIRSDDGGTSWYRVTALPDSICNVVYVAQDSAGNNVIYAGFGDESQNVSGALYRSDDGGQSWNALTGAIDETTGQSLPIYDIAGKNTRADSLVCAAGRCAAYSANYGDSLQCVVPRADQSVDMNSPMTSIDICKNDPDSVFIGQGKNVWLLHMSPEMDTAKDDGCTEDSCWGDSCRIICCNADSCDTMVVDTTRKPDGPMPDAPILSLYHTGYPGEIVHDVHYDALTMTSSTGFYEIRANVTSSQGPPVSARPHARMSRAPRIAVRITPNPFTHRLTIRYQLPAAMHIRAALYRLDGSMVSLLHNGYARAGTHAHRINRSDFMPAAGIYLFKLQSTEHTIVRKLLRIR